MERRLFGEMDSLQISGRDDRAADNCFCVLLLHVILEFVTRLSWFTVSCIHHGGLSDV